MFWRMKYRLELGIWGSVFAVPTQIVDRHLKLCGAAQLKVLLTLLRHGDGPMALDELTHATGLSPGDAQDALLYWLECGVLSANDGADATLLLPGTAPAPVASTPANGGTEAEPEAPARARVLPAPPQRPKPPEIQRLVREDAQLGALLHEAEAALGKLLTSSDISTLVSLYDWGGVPADVLLTVICYCKSLGKQNLRYIEKVAISWLEQGIDTLEKADAHLREASETDVQTGLVKSAFGIHGRALTAKETAFVRQWFGEYGFDIPLIRLAFERAVDRTGKVSFPYIGKILANWHEKGVRSPEDATRLEGTRARERAATEKSGSSYDIDEIAAQLSRGSPKLD